MTSQEGRWFVDELAAALSWLERLGRLVSGAWPQQQPPAPLREALDDLAAAQDVMQALQVRLSAEVGGDWMVTVGAAGGRR